MRIFTRVLFLALALMVAIVQPSAVARAASEIVTFSAIVSAGAVSAMIFSGTILGTRIRENLVEAVEVRFWGSHQNYWFLMFAFATATSVFVIFGQLINWKFPVEFELFKIKVAFNLAAVIAFASIACMGLAIALLFDFANAVRDVIDLSTNDKILQSEYAKPSKLNPDDVENTIEVLS